MQSAFSIISSFKNPALTLDPSNPQFSEDKRPSTTFKLGGVCLTRKADIAGNKNREPLSIVWLHGEALVRLSDKKEVFYCYDCERKGRAQKIPVLNGTRGAGQHLKTVHNYNLSTGDVEERPSSLETSQSDVITVVNKFSFDAFKENLVLWFVCCQSALNMLVHPLFRELVSYLNAGLGGLLPEARSTL